MVVNEADIAYECNMDKSFNVIVVCSQYDFQRFSRLISLFSSNVPLSLGLFVALKQP